MKLVIPDALAETYEAHAKAQGQDLATLIAAQLERFKDTPPGKRHLVLGEAALGDLEGLLGGNQILTPEILLAQVKTRGVITFESLDLKLTTKQKQELTARATKNGKPLAQLVDEIYQLLIKDFFSAAGEGASGRPAAVPAAVAPAPPDAPRGRKLSHHERMAAHLAQRKLAQGKLPVVDERATEG